MAQVQTYGWPHTLIKDKKTSLKTSLKRSQALLALLQEDTKLL